MRAILVGMTILSVCLPAVVQAQIQQLDQPSLGQAQPIIYLSNRTSGQVVFYLETSGTARTEHRLGANESASFTGAAGDKWFNIEIHTAKGGSSVLRKYGVNVGERNYIDWSDGVLDVFKLPPGGR